MKHDDRDRYLTRERVLNLLSDDEIARVSTAESGPRLEYGEECLDLEALERGVQRAFSQRIVGIETVDHPSDGQLVAHAKRYFGVRGRGR